MDQLDLAKSDLDKKGYWLAALCAGILGFVLNQCKESASTEEVFLYLLTIPFLFMGLIYAVLSLILKGYGPKGLSPKIAFGKFKDINPPEKNMKLLWNHTLTEYGANINTNYNNNKVKIRHINTSTGWIRFSVGFLINAYSFPLSFPLFMKLSSHIQAWACSSAGL